MFFPKKELNSGGATTVRLLKLRPDRDRHIVVRLQHTDLYGVEKHEAGMGETGEIFPQRLYIA
jgi:hypothetical protein